jgi:hypothetical protein
MTRELMRGWFAVFAGPLAWFAAHVASWMLAPGAHDTSSIVGLYLVDIAALGIAVTAGVVALGRIRALRGAPPTDQRTQRAWFIAGCGLGLSALSVVLVIGLSLPMLLLLPGAEP